MWLCGQRKSIPSGCDWLHKHSWTKRTEITSIYWMQNWKKKRIKTKRLPWRLKNIILISSNIEISENNRKMHLHFVNDRLLLSHYIIQSCEAIQWSLGILPTNEINPPSRRPIQSWGTSNWEKTEKRRNLTWNWTISSSCVCIVQ